MSPLNFFYSCYRNTLRHPKLRWWIIGGSLLYVLSPVDIAPDILPGIGQVDDGIVVTILAAEMSQIALENLKTRKQRKRETGSAESAAQLSQAKFNPS
jgi:uncharacterized membrane protein YkvA (DUF1232 family)